jgi:hypothetical protein
MSGKIRSMQIRNAEKVLLEIRQLLSDINIVFFLRHGTCLGAVRDGELIPWDDDIDIGSIIGMHNLDESSISRAVKRFEATNFQVKVLETDLHIGVELSKFGIPVDWTCYRVLEESIFQYPGVKIPVQLYEKLSSVSLLGKPFSVPNPPEEYLTLKYGPNWIVPKKTGFEADIIDSIPESINLEKSPVFTRVLKFFFPKHYLARIKVLSSDLQPIPNMEVAIVGIGRRMTDHNGYATFDVVNEDYYAVDVGSGENREILYEEILKPGKDYSYIRDPYERQGRIHVLQEKN